MQEKGPAGYPGTGDLGHVLGVVMSGSPDSRGSCARPDPRDHLCLPSRPGIQSLILGLSPSTPVDSQKSLRSEWVPPEWEMIHLMWKMGDGGGQWE